MYTQFAQLAAKERLELIYWNNTPLNLEKLGHQEIPFPKVALHWRTDALKNAIKHNELNKFKNESKNPIFDAYKFAWNSKGIKNKVKTFIAKRYVKKTPTNSYIQRLREKLKKQEKRTTYYKTCFNTIKEIQPDLVFCASQRPIAAVAPLEAAKALNIKTVCAIFSWDNLPKATLVAEADHYLVWSEHMKEELASYYPFTSSSKTHITGTPQFENHYNPEFLLDKDRFFKEHGLDPEKKYICFSGDDVTTSPFDPQYLNDVAEAVRNYNSTQEEKLGIIFRRCPVDFSNRYDYVLAAHSAIIKPIAPLWDSVGGNWDKKVPTKEDLILQATIAHHTKLVINVGSSMVFDYAAHNTPCAYLNYNPEGSDTNIKDIHTIYKYMHFQSMPTSGSVIWLDSKETILDSITRVLDAKNLSLEQTHNWFQKIVHHPVEGASQRIVSILKTLQ